MIKEYIEAQVVFLTRRIHPQDLGEETSKLENTLRQALEDVEQEMLKKVVGILTNDISTSDFTEAGRKLWELSENNDRGIEPCIECENGIKIRTLLSSLQKKE